MYVLCYLASGNLPWKTCKATDSGLDKMLKMKMKISPYELFQAFPIEYSQMLEHIKSQPYEQACDYEYIDSLLRSVAYKTKFKIDNVFEWLSAKRKMTLDLKFQKESESKNKN